MASGGIIAAVMAGALAQALWAQAPQPTGAPKSFDAPKPTQPQPPNDLPDAAALFEKHIQAIGGDAAMRAERNRVLKGTMTQSTEGRRVTVNLAIYRAAPNMMYMVLEAQPDSKSELWFDGREGWQRAGTPLAQPILPEMLPEVRRNADFFGEANYKERYKELTTVERQIFNGRFAYVVRGMTADGQPRTLFFDAESGLLIGVRTSQPGLLGSIDRTAAFSDYKKIGDVMQTTRITQKEGNTETVTVLDSIQSNQTTLPPFSPKPSERDAAAGPGRK